MVNEYRSPTRRRRAWVALVLAGAVIAAGCSSGDDDGDAAAGGGEADGDRPAGEAAAPWGPFAVGRRTITLVDDSRPTDAVPAAGLDAVESRTIEVELVYPAAGDGGSTGTTAGAPDAGAGIDAVESPGSVEDAAPAEGTFPLVVWAHGFTSRGDVFRPYGELWAREGYVVALPTFPLSREGVGFSDDVQNQPGDVSFVIDEVLGLPDDDPLAGLADGEHVAVAGHSLGSATVFGVTYNSCCADDRIDAAVSVSGGGLPYEGGDYEDPPATPLLLAHGARDPLVPVAAGDATFRGHTAPVTYLRLAEADHNNLFWGEDGALLNQAILAFLDAELRGDPAALDALPGEVEASGRATLETK